LFDAERFVVVASPAAVAAIFAGTSDSRNFLQRIPHLTGYSL